jgi:hypothetical protein
VVQVDPLEIEDVPHKGLVDPRVCRGRKRLLGDARMMLEGTFDSGTHDHRKVNGGVNLQTGSDALDRVPPDTRDTSTIERTPVEQDCRIEGLY